MRHNGSQASHTSNERARSGCGALFLIPPPRSVGRVGRRPGWGSVQRNRSRHWEFSETPPPDTSFAALTMRHPPHRFAGGGMKSVAERRALPFPSPLWGGWREAPGGGSARKCAKTSLPETPPTRHIGSLRSRCATLPTASQGREKRQRVRRHTASRGRDKKEPGIPAVVPAFAATTRHSPRSQLSSPGLTGRPSIPEALVINREATAYWFPAFAGMTTGVAARP
jgi:hypothetical protein